MQNVDLERLSPRSKAIRIAIGDQMPEGYNLTEIANELGRTTSWVSERLTELRNELLLQTGHFFPLTDHEYQALHDSIQTHGVQVPVIIGEHIACLDGRHRLLIAENLGLTNIPALFLEGLTADQEHELSVALNAARRQLNRAQRRKLVEAELMRDPNRSDRYIAAICGTAHSTVSLTRAEILHHQKLEQQSPPAEPVDESSTAPPPSPTVESSARIGRDGLEHTVTSSGPTTRGPAAALQPDRPLGYAECLHGQRHAIYKDGTGYRLETV